MEPIQEEFWINDVDVINERAENLPIAIRAIFTRICIEARQFPFYLGYKGPYIYTEIHNLVGTVSWPNGLMDENWLNFRFSIGEARNHNRSRIDFLKLEKQMFSSENQDSPYLISFELGESFLVHVTNDTTLPTTLPEGEPTICFSIYGENLNRNTALITLNEF
jgi:hypothetical protein